MPAADWFAKAFGELIADIRRKVVEEPWFGRTVTPAHQPPAPSLAEGLGWALAQSEARQPSAPVDRDVGLGIDH